MSTFHDDSDVIEVDFHPTKIRLRDYGKMWSTTGVTTGRVTVEKIRPDDEPLPMTTSLSLSLAGVLIIFFNRKFHSENCHFKEKVWSAIYILDFKRKVGTTTSSKLVLLLLLQLLLLLLLLLLQTGNSVTWCHEPFGLTTITIATTTTTTTIFITTTTTTTTTIVITTTTIATTIITIATTTFATSTIITITITTTTISVITTTACTTTTTIATTTIATTIAIITTTKR